METVVDSEKAKTKMTYRGQPLVLDAKYPVGEVHMHPETLYQMTGQRPEGHRTGDVIVLREGGR